MEIRIKETGKIETLELVDPKTGVNWIRDLMGNHNETPPMEEDEDGYETGRYVMDKESFDWWSDLSNRYQEADDRCQELRESLTGSEYEEFLESLSRINVDLEDCPQAMNDICDEFEK